MIVDRGRRSIIIIFITGTVQVARALIYLCKVLGYELVRRLLGLVNRGCVSLV